MAKQIVGEVSKDTVSALKDAIKSHFDIPQGSSLAGTVTFVVDFDYKRGQDFSKTVPQAACPWTLLHKALSLAGFQRERIREIVAEVQEMSDAERKDYRDSMSEQVQSIMSDIGATTTKTVKGMQTFDAIQVTVNP
jgi:hypothetical protein